ncbi:MAG: hypothetical protein H6684_15125 [Deltaproteobacteria bacterium]|nr:hypothetical protein [Deltaproteobacteria bacterium]MCB9490064.1 hypothetical protein [Deltaproteobacteria bacterium]
MNDQQRFNLVQYRPDQAGGMVESFFFKTADPQRGASLWIKFTILKPEDGGPARASVWATRVVANNAARSIGMRNEFPVEDWNFEEEKVGLVAGPCAFGDGFTHGRLEDAFGRVIEWDIKLDGGRELMIYPHKWMLTKAFPRFKTWTPYADTIANGHFTVEGARTEVQNLRAMQGHNWGNAHTTHYAWSHCNTFDNAPDTVFEGFSARMSMGGKETPFLTMAVLRHEGKDYKFNRLRKVRAKESTMNRQCWSFTMEDQGLQLMGMVIGHRHDFAGLVYPNPDGTEKLCVNTGVANANVELSRIKDGEVLAKLTTTRGAMLELISPDPWFDVCVQIPGH